MIYSQFTHKESLQELEVDYTINPNITKEDGKLNCFLSLLNSTLKCSSSQRTFPVSIYLLSVRI